MAVAIVSLATGKPVSDEIAMTGEITLTGQVLPIGGVREKVLAAKRAGLNTVVLPLENEPDLEELPEETRDELEFILADSIDDVFNAAFSPAMRAPAQAGPPAERAAAAPSH
jgi:ATP-dependent Lon protease